MKGVHRSLYNFLCTGTHNNIRALIDRHIEVDQNDFAVVYFKQKAIEEFLPYVDSLCALLINTSIIIHEFLRTDAQADFETLNERLQKSRATYKTVCLTTDCTPTANGGC